MFDKLMDLDFLEIGTSNFDTLIQSSEDQVGMSVEPIAHYLNDLPNKPNVIKVNAAITSDKISNTIDVYYVPEDVILANNLIYWLKGCNSIGKYHYQHEVLNIKQFVRIEKVPLMNINELLTQYNIRGIKYLKIDTEGHDCVILKGLFEYLKTKTTEYYPKRILFETNILTPPDIINATIEAALSLGYVVEKRDSDDTILVYNGSRS
jgi:hypothetical protein